MGASVFMGSAFMGMDQREGPGGRCRTAGANHSVTSSGTPRRVNTERRNHRGSPRQAELLARAVRERNLGGVNVARHGRHVAVLQDYGLWEFTVLVRQPSQTASPKPVAPWSAISASRRG